MSKECGKTPICLKLHTEYLHYFRNINWELRPWQHFPPLLVDAVHHGTAILQ